MVFQTLTLLVLLLLVMMIDNSLPIREVGLNTASSKGVKRKLTGQTTAEEMKPSEVKAVKASKAPLKAELIIKFKL